MTMRIIRFCATFALALAATQTIASAEEGPGIEGVWSVNVTIRQCQNNVVLRNLRALNLFIHDGSLTETAANVLRSPSVGEWKHVQGHTYSSTFRFFRYNPDGSFASTAKVTRTIEFFQDGNHFTSTGTVEDFNADNVLISTSCATETATRAQ
jgi:hypothetical protein